MSTIWIIVVAALAFGLARQFCKNRSWPWWKLWCAAGLAACGCTFVALMPGLLSLTTAFTAAATGAFFGLCYDPRRNGS